MSIHVALEHHTHYAFDRPVGIGPHVVRLRPAPHSRTPVLSYSLTVEPADHFLNWQQDAFGNFLARLVFPAKATELTITVDLVADLTVVNPFDFFVEPDAERFPFHYGPDERRDLSPYFEVEEPGPHLTAWLAEVEVPADGLRIVDFLVAVNQRLQGDIAYTTRFEPGVQTPEQTLGLALGSCRDTGWLLVQILRHLGLAARFVSGYLVQLAPDVRPLDGPAGPERDFTDLHAWCEVYVPGAGWIGLDPTSGLFAGEGHIPLACTPNPVTAAAVTGVVDECEVTLTYRNEVHRIHEDPRVTLPYTDDQWRRIDALGDAVDDRLTAGDVRLTQGGEPTFVSVDDMESAEWNTAADDAAAPPPRRRWRLRRGRLHLIPGDSPIGLRLPLDSLTWTPTPVEPDRSPFDERSPLPDRRPVRRVAPVAGHATATVVPVEAAPPTALGVELCEGRLTLFLPPLTHFEDAVELLGVIEAVAATAGHQLVVGGYPPPADPRHRVLVVAPDPGVIEVNLHPARSWRELVDTTEALYATAAGCRLGTEKFELDGTHSGSGGGNHVTLGGATPADSPLLRRPDLLRSLVTYWQHHPSLSYLFSGRFIGPTSQAPRVDEARHDALDELEIAFAELERHGSDTPPWLVDRLFRHLLTDLTGNTHRAEFCIDKLFSPESDRGRLGLVELRGFEMPPHPRMALVQGLLVRALVARFWDEPYAEPLVRWGTELHDRFLLPWGVATDIARVVDDLTDHGIPFELPWLDPFLEFRFPRLGETTVAGVHLELRAGIEPWLALGEEVTANATARYVDSSVERLQVRVDGFNDGRLAVTCNGRLVPLRPTGTPGTWVAGVRYRAWQPPSALHPTIGVHAPLTFDLVDLHNGRSLGGCRYHVSHPGGRAYETFPVNASEAESRRGSRFVATGHTPGPVDVAPLLAQRARGEGYPRTLDLRRPAPGPASPP